MSESAGASGSRSGLFVVVEGVDGAGKSTLLRSLADALRNEGEQIVETREPGGAPGAEEIRRLLVGGETDRWSPTAELLLFNAARRDHLDKTVEPALARGAIVLCDRFVDSTRAYQSAGRGADRGLVDALHKLAIGREADAAIFAALDEAMGAGAPGPLADCVAALRAPEDTAGGRPAADADPQAPPANGAERVEQVLRVEQSRIDRLMD